MFTAKKTSSSDKDQKDVIDLNKKDKAVEDKKESMKDLYSEASSGATKKQSARKTSIAYRVLERPLVTEKAANLGELNQYVFIISTSANKIDVSKAIFEVYGVKPLSVNIVKMKGKAVSRGRITGKRKDFKKAIVTLKKGDSITIYEGV